MINLLSNDIHHPDLTGLGTAGASFTSLIVSARMRDISASPAILMTDFRERDHPSLLQLLNKKEEKNGLNTNLETPGSEQEQ